MDDDKDVLAAAKVMLEAYGFTVTYASNAHEAVAAVLKSRPDVILSDVFMPDGDGFELLEELRGSGEHIPIVIMSGGVHASNNHLDLAAKLGATAVVAKPFNARDIVAILRQAISKSADATVEDEK